MAQLKLAMEISLSTDDAAETAALTAAHEAHLSEVSQHSRSFSKSTHHSKGVVDPPVALEREACMRSGQVSQACQMPA